MGNPYPVEITDDQGEARLTGYADFTDAQNQPGGGSQPVKTIRFPFAFDTPGLKDGLTVYTPSDGDMLASYQLAVSMPTPFNGTTPTISIGFPNDDGYDSIVNTDASVGNTPVVGGGGNVIAGAIGTGLLGLVFDGSQPVILAINDGTRGGDSGATAGAGELIMIVIPAAS